jgi:hypothetical protein
MVFILIFIIIVITFVVTIVVSDDGGTAGGEGLVGGYARRAGDPSGNGPPRTPYISLY